LSRIHRSYRFSEESIKRLARLEERLQVTKTDVLAQALATLEEVLDTGVSEVAARRGAREREKP